ncbi:MAG: M48 family metalloprotease [Deltaproteobacteria bacterium]|nr:M48 family metalloprotease [Deltaproteobacteria bacterium]
MSRILKNEKNRFPWLARTARGLVALGLLAALSLMAGCAEVTRPNPSDLEQEEVQLTAARRHPYQTWSGERVSRVFLHLLPCLPQVHGRTYPFLGFNWWVTAAGKVAVDQVWRPSPAADAGLKQGDIILAVNNWPIPAEAAAWDRNIKAVRDVFKNFLFFVPVDSYETVYKYKRSERRVQHYVYMCLPGEVLPAVLLDLKHIDMEARGRYLTGPVELLIQREEKKFGLTLYPQHLPAEYAILLDSKGTDINAYAALGKIIVTQRFVNFCLNDDELALVIGHELAHQAKGHLIRGAAHRELGKFAGAAVTAFSTLSLNHLLDWRHSMVSPDVRQVAGDAVVSVFSQDDEREADIYGAWYAFQAGYDLDKGLAVWERLAAVKDHDPFESNYFLDSHPAPLERLAALKKVTRYFQAGRAAEVFLQAKDLNRRPAP